MYKFIYFDVGGVVIDDFSANSKWQELQNDLGITPENHEAFWAIWQEHASRLCIDRDADVIVPHFREKLGLSLADDYSLLNDFVNRFYANPAIWPAIRQAQSQARVGLLTNMYPRMLDTIIKRELLPDITWDVIVDSSIEQLQKPDPKLYEIAQDRAGVAPEEILFIDNLPENLKVAEAMGWQTHWYDPSNHQQSAAGLVQKFQYEPVV